MLLFFGGWPGFFRRWHQARPQVFHYLEPQLMVKNRLVALELVERYPAFVFAVAMAIKAILLQDWPDFLAKMRQCRRLRRAHGGRAATSSKNQQPVFHSSHRPAYLNPIKLCSHQNVLQIRVHYLLATLRISCNGCSSSRF